MHSNMKCLKTKKNFNLQVSWGSDRGSSSRLDETKLRSIMQDRLLSHLRLWTLSMWNLHASAEGADVGCEALSKQIIYINKSLENIIVRDEHSVKQTLWIAGSWSP